MWQNRYFQLRVIIFMSDDFIFLLKRKNAHRKFPELKTMSSNVFYV